MAAVASPTPSPDSGEAIDRADREWLEGVYRRGQRQLTARAVVSGMLIGALMCLSNLYVVLKTGWSLGVTITAGLLGFALFRLLHALRIVKSPLGLLENGAISSVAASAGYMTAGGNMAAIPALFMLTGQRPEGMKMFFWFACIATMGVFCAIPIKRQLVNHEKLPFPPASPPPRRFSLSMGRARRAIRRAGLGGLPCRAPCSRGCATAKAKWMPFNVPDSFSFPGFRGAVTKRRSGRWHFRAAPFSSVPARS